MRRSLWFLVKVAVLVAIAVWLAGTEGQVEVTWLGYEVIAPFGVFALVVVVLMVLTVVLYRLWRGVRRAPAAIGRNRAAGRRDRGYRALTSGMVAVAAGDADTARRQARRADSLLHDPPLTMLLSAQAAQLNGDDSAARQYFEAMLKRREMEFLGLRGLLTQALRDGDQVGALRLAQRARGLRPETPWLLRTSFDLEVRLRRWAEALHTLAQAERRHVFPAEELRRYRAAILVERSREAEAGGEAATALELAHQAVAALPGFVPAVTREARLLMRTDHRRKAGKLLERAWMRQPHPDLAAAYRDLGGGDEEEPLARVKRFERLQGLAEDDPVGLAVLGEAELEAQLWAAARTHLTRAEEMAPSRRVYRLLAELEVAENNDPTAARDWLTRAEQAPPDPAWVCESCGAIARVWTALCSNCGSFCTLTWRSPALAVHLPSPDAPLELPPMQAAATAP